MISVSSIANEQTLEQHILIAQAADSGASEPQSVPSGKWISNGEHLGKWWETRARKMKTLPSELLYHLVGEYSINEETGNADQTKHNAKVTLSLRKGFINSTTSFVLTDEKNKGNSVKEKMVLDEFAYWEFSDWIDFGFGAQWYSYDKRYIEDRYKTMAGLYFTLLDEENLTFKVGPFYGYSSIAYMNDKIAKKEPGLHFDDYKSDFLYLAQRFAWSMNDKLTFSQKGFYQQYLEDSDLVDSDLVHWGFNLDLDYKLTKHFSIFGKYDVDYELTEVNQSVQGQEKKDTELTFGIRINF